MRKWHAFIILFVTLLDRFVKIWAAKVLKPLAARGLPLWDGVFHFTYVENRGAAFGMLQGQRVFFLIIFAVLMLVLLWFLFVRLPSNKFSGIALAVLLGGAFGNFYDRLLYGYVVDMFDFRLINFAVFNVADSAITVGVIVWALIYIIEDTKQSKQKKPQTKDARLASGGEGEDVQGDVPDKL